MSTSNNKILGQSNPAATTSTTLYTVPTAAQTVCNMLSICNLGAATTFRVSVVKNGDSVAAKNYVAYDNSVSGNDSVFLSPFDVTLSSGDSIAVYAGTTNIAFSLFGQEII